MLELIKDWWAVIAAFIGSFIWLGRLHADVTALKDEKYVSCDRCVERRAVCIKANDMQAASTQEQFKEVKKMITDNDRASLERHTELMQVLLASKQH